MINKVCFIGSKNLGIQALKKMHSLSPDTLSALITVDDSYDSRSVLTEFKKFASKAQIDFFILKSGKMLEPLIEEIMPDLCIVVGWYWILKESLLAKVKHGVLGFHGSLLPKYRGSAPLVWPIINGDSESGITFFYFDNGIDTGDIIDQRIFSIEENNSIADILVKAEKGMLEMLDKNYTLLLSGSATRIKQNHDDATYCSIRKAEDGKIDWNQSPQKIYDFIRAQTHPYPGAFTVLPDKNKLIFWAVKKSTINEKLSPGEVKIVQENVLIGCVNGALQILKTQIEDGSESNPINILKQGMTLL